MPAHTSPLDERVRDLAVQSMTEQIDEREARLAILGEITSSSNFTNAVAKIVRASNPSDASVAENRTLLVRDQAFDALWRSVAGDEPTLDLAAVAGGVKIGAWMWRYLEGASRWIIPAVRRIEARHPEPVDANDLIGHRERSLVGVSRPVGPEDSALATQAEALLERWVSQARNLKGTSRTRAQARMLASALRLKPFISPDIAEPDLRDGFIAWLRANQGTSLINSTLRSLSAGTSEPGESAKLLAAMVADHRLSDLDDLARQDARVIAALAEAAVTPKPLPSLRHLKIMAKMLSARTGLPEKRSERLVKTWARAHSDLRDRSSLEVVSADESQANRDRFRELALRDLADVNDLEFASPRLLARWCSDTLTIIESQEWGRIE